jgi:hypothetical protein
MLAFLAALALGGSAASRFKVQRSRFRVHFSELVGATAVANPNR